MNFVEGHSRQAGAECFLVVDVKKNGPSTTRWNPVGLVRTAFLAAVVSLLSAISADLADCYTEADVSRVNSVFIPQAEPLWAGAAGIGRRVFYGSRQDALEQMRSNIRRWNIDTAVAVNAAPVSNDDVAAILRTQKPVDSSPEGRKLYEIDGPFPLVLRTQTLNKAEDTSLVVTAWAMLVPVQPGCWSIYQWHCSPVKENDLGTMPGLLPLNSCETMRLRGQSRTTIGIHGETNLAEWQHHFDRQARQHDWQTREAWSHAENSGTAVYATRDGDRLMQIHVHLTQRQPNQLQGMITMTTH